MNGGRPVPRAHHGTVDRSQPLSQEASFTHASVLRDPARRVMSMHIDARAARSAAPGALPWLRLPRAAWRAAALLDAAVVGRCGADVEFAEDVVDVAFDGLGAEEQALADACVGVSLGHELEDLAFTFGELGEGADVA